MKAWFFSLSIIAAVASTCLVQARERHSQPPCQQQCQKLQCPSCRAYCELSIEKGKEKHYCWDIECKPICIPRVRFPWERCCEPKCAKVKYVRKLKKIEYECEHCKYKWTPVVAPCCQPEPDSCHQTVMRPEENAQPAPSKAPSSSGIFTWLTGHFQSRTR